MTEHWFRRKRAVFCAGFNVAKEMAAKEADKYGNKALAALIRNMEVPENAVHIRNENPD